MLPFLIGLLLGVAIGWSYYYTRKREVARLAEEKQMLQQEKQIVLDFMHNMVEAIGEGMNRQELFQRAVHAVILSTGALSGCVFERIGEKRLRAAAVEGLFPPQHPLPESSRIKLSTRSKFIEQILTSELFEISEGIIGEVARTGEPILIPDARQDPRVFQHDDVSLTVESLIVVPIQFRQQVIGALAVANPADGEPFNEMDFSLANSMAEQAGLAIHNADLMDLQIEQKKLEFDLTLASNIQTMLLPKEFPNMDRFAIDALYLPAQKIGGDLYDVFQLPGNKIGIAIADVSGKGIPASLLMAICQSNLRHYGKCCDSPAEALRHVNQVMTEEMRKDMFVTVIYAVVDMDNETVTVARAGHELPLHFHKVNGSDMWRANAIGSEGMALGMVESRLFDAVISEVTIKLNPGDLFILYTDGVTEAINEEEVEFSTTRLCDTIKTLRNRSPRQINEGVLETVTRFASGKGFLDDFSLVTLKHL